MGAAHTWRTRRDGLSGIRIFIAERSHLFYLWRRQVSVLCQNNSDERKLEPIQSKTPTHDVMGVRDSRNFGVRA